MSQKIALSFYLFFICSLAHTPAQAAIISNMTDSVQTLMIQNGNTKEEVPIAPYGSLTRSGNIRVNYRNHELYVEENMEYAIWPGDTIGPQRRWKKQHRGI